MFDLENQMVVAHSRLAMRPTDPIEISIVERTRAPHAGQLPRFIADYWFAVDGCLDRLVLKSGDSLVLIGICDKLGALSIGWQSGAKHPGQQLSMSRDVVGDAAVVAEKKPRYAANRREAFVPGRRGGRHTRVLEAYKLVEEHSDHILLREVEGRLGKIAMLQRTFIERMSLEDAAAVGWQLGFWFPAWRLVTDLGGSMFLVLAELTGLVGTVIDRSGTRI